MRAIVITFAVFACFAYASAHAADWPMLACNPQRSNYTPEVIEFPYLFAWEQKFEPERVSLKAQPVIADGRVFMGTKAGNLYALDAKTGARLWVYETGGIIDHAAGVDGSRVFVACLDGTVHAVDTQSGKGLWIFRSQLAGFTGAVLPVEGKVFIGDRRGVVFAVAQADGAELWRQDLGAPIVQTAAYDAGQIFIGAEDMKIRCLDAASGAIVWASDRLYGQSFKQYHPVITQGRVLTTVFPSECGFNSNGPFFPWQNKKTDELKQKFYPLLREGKIPDEMVEEEERMVRVLSEEHPEWQAFYVLDQKTGKQVYVAPSWRGPSMGGPCWAPAIDHDGKAIVPISGIPGRATGAARFDLGKGRLSDILFGDLCDGFAACERAKLGWTWLTRGMDDPQGRVWGGGSMDEKTDISCAGPVVFFAEPQEGNCHFTGTFDLRTRRWVGLSHSQVRPGAFKHVDHTHFQDGVWTRGTPFAIAGGMFFHNCYGHVHAWKGAGLLTPEERADLLMGVK